MLFIIEIFTEFSLEMKPYLHLALCRLSCFSDCECVDKEDGEAKEENQSCNGKVLEPRRKIFVFTRYQGVVQKSEEWCCQERTNHGKAEHG